MGIQGRAQGNEVRLVQSFLKDRCEGICGGSGESCLTSNNNQVTCVADMVVNQAYGILSLIDMAKNEQDPDTANEYLEDINTISSELINWAKYLQVAHDIKSVMRQMHTSGNIKRRELRYPFPEELNEFISLRVDGLNDPADATLINFSQSGIQFNYDGAPPDEPNLTCTLISPERIGKKVSFLCEVKYFTEHDDRMLIGAQITEVSNSTDFNFFMSVLDIMNDITEPKEGVSG